MQKCTVMATTDTILYEMLLLCKVMTRNCT